jgi:hypothetical protein
MSRANVELVLDLDPSRCEVTQMCARAAWRLVMAAAIVGCSSGERLLGVNDVVIDRTYRLQSCDLSMAPSAGCVTNRTGGTQQTADSGRVVFKKDRTMTWTVWYTDYENPCYLGPMPACPKTTYSVSNLSGTYQLESGGIRATLGNELFSGTGHLAADIPSMVGEDWTGPESFQAYLSGGLSLISPVVFK